MSDYDVILEDEKRSQSVDWAPIQKIKNKDGSFDR